MAQGGNNLKRPRRDTDASSRAQAESPAFTRDEEFWFEDGSIVLVARDTGFRVYRELLARRSQIFRDLFAVPQPADGLLVAGCPVVHLSETPEAARELLEALLYGKM